ncbi:MAG TPA: hypothetical protein VF868_15030 [Bacteroidia bacterium]|jgi:hypothetical protein
MKRKEKFEVLTMDEQVDITWQGEFISSIKVKNYCLLLYLVEDSYFVEVFYNSHKKEIISIKLLDESRLPLYADDISLEDLY